MELLHTGQFLAISRQTPEQLPLGQQIKLSNGVSCIVKCAGVIVFEPKTVSHKHIILSSGVHGNETAPVEICDQLVQDILLQRIVPVHRVMFIFGNLPAMDIEKRFVQENLNRLFKQGLIAQHPEEHRAVELMNCVDEFYALANGDQQDSNTVKIHYDLHTAIRDSKNEKFVVYPYLYGREHNKEQLQFLSDCDVNTVLLSQGPTTTFSHYSSKNHNAHGFTVELGKVKPFGQNDMTRFEKARHMLVKLLCQLEPALTPYDECPLEIFKVAQEVMKTKEDFKLHFADDVANFTEFAQGELIASESGVEFRAIHPNEAIVFPNANVEIGQRALLTVVPCAI